LKVGVIRQRNSSLLLGSLKLILGEIPILMKKLTIIILWILLGSAAHAQNTPSDLHIEKINSKHIPATVEFSNGFYALKNTKGKLLTEFIFSDIRSFRNGLAAVEQNNKWGFVNVKGELMIPVNYDIVFDFNDKITMVYVDGIWKAIDKKGIVLFVPGIDNCFGFQNGVAQIESKGRKGNMDIHGNINFTEKSLIQNTNSAFSSARNSSESCPNNIDFENGSFDGWQCFTGSVDTIGNTNVVTVTPSSPVTNRHKILSRSESGNLDQYGLFSTNAPDGSNYTVKLGNKNSGAQAERIRYTVYVPENVSDFSLRYDCAVVFQDPGHTDCSQPRFVAKLFDSAANAYIDCATADYISTSNLPGFAVSAVDPVVIYKPWSSIFINLSAFAGKTMYLEFTTADCARRAHWGYAYIDVETVCQESIKKNFDCNTPETTGLFAPGGFQQYNWFNADYSVLVSTGQNVVINNQANQLVHVEMIPYNGFGCKDTLTVELNNNNLPSIQISTQQTSCTEKTYGFKCINSASIPVWNFGDGTIITGDTITHIFTQNGEYIITLNTTTFGGCELTLTDTLSIENTYTQGEIFIDSIQNCFSTTIHVFQSDSLNNNIVWNFGDGSTATGNHATHEYIVSGNYEITSNVESLSGCNYQKSKWITVNSNQLPSVSILSPDQSCASTDFYAKTLITGNTNIQSIQWNVPSTNIISYDSILLNIPQPGIFNLSVNVVTTTGCAITANKNITINQTPQLNELPNLNSCAGNKIDSIVLSGMNGEASYFWLNNNTGIGLSANGINTIPAFVAPANINSTASAQIVVYAISNNGCSSDSVHFNININSLPIINLDDTIRQCKGTALELQLSNDLNYQWNNTNGINCENCSTTFINATENTNYVVEATDNKGCKSKDSVFVEVIQPTNVNINSLDTICTGRSVHLHASGADLYNWFPEIGLDDASSSAPIAAPSSNTNYRLIGSDRYGCFSDTQFVFVATTQMSRNDVTSEVSALSGTTVVLNPELLQSNIVSYEWSPVVNLSCYDCATPVANVENNMTYVLKTINSRGCVTEQNVDIRLISPKVEVFIPNTFSPDGNGVNDVLYIRGKGFTVKSFSIYDRRGRLVFRKNNILPNDISQGWDGRCGGITQPSDTYVYIAEITDIEGNTTLTKGNSSLLR
jgi:gliding motility-associated-like protein